MLNHDLLERLYKKLPKEKRQELLRALFGEGRQSMAYFRRNNDTSLSKVLTLSRYFNVPIDALMQGSGYDPDKPASADAASNPEGVEYLKEKMHYLEEIAQLKEDKVQLLLEKVEMLKAQAKKNEE